jgi:hypothetical protein
MLEAPPGFEPGIEVLQTSALPLGDGAVQVGWMISSTVATSTFAPRALRRTTFLWLANRSPHKHKRAKVGAGNGIRTRDFDLGKVALYH